MTARVGHFCDECSCETTGEGGLCEQHPEASVSSILLDQAAAVLGRRGGKARTPAKTAAARANGARGGAPAGRPRRLLGDITRATRAWRQHVESRPAWWEAFSSALRNPYADEIAAFTQQALDLDRACNRAVDAALAAGFSERAVQNAQRRGGATRFV